MFVTDREGGCLRVLILRWDPWVKWAEDKPPSTATGVMRTLMDIFAERIGFCYVVDTPLDMDLGTPLKNGSFTGVIGELSRWEADMTMAPLSVSQIRAKAIDFSESLHVDQHHLMYRRPKTEADMVGFLKPFSLTLWLAVLVTTLVVCGAIFLVHLAVTEEAAGDGEGRAPLGRPTRARGIGKGDSSVAFRFRSAVLWTLSCLCSQSVPWQPRDVPVRVVAGIWLLAALIIGTVYRSNLKAMLILPKVAVPFDSFEEFTEVDLPSFIITGGIIDIATKNSAPNSTLGKIRAKSFVDHDISRSLQKIYQGKGAGIATLSGITAINHYDFTANGRCQMATTRAGIFSTSIALGFPKGSSLKPKVDFIIRGLKEFGILHHLFQREIPNGTVCLKSPGSTSSSPVELRPLELGDFYGIFSLFSGGMAIATLVFVMEHLVKRMAGRSSQGD